MTTPHAPNEIWDLICASCDWPQLLAITDTYPGAAASQTYTIQRRRRTFLNTIRRLHRLKLDVYRQTLDLFLKIHYPDDRDKAGGIGLVVEELNGLKRVIRDEVQDLLMAGELVYPSEVREVLEREARDVVEDLVGGWGEREEEDAGMGACRAMVGVEVSGDG